MRRDACPEVAESGGAYKVVETAADVEERHIRSGAANRDEINVTPEKMRQISYEHSQVYVEDKRMEHSYKFVEYHELLRPRG